MKTMKDCKGLAMKYKIVLSILGIVLIAYYTANSEVDSDNFGNYCIYNLKQGSK